MVGEVKEPTFVSQRVGKVTLSVMFLPCVPNWGHLQSFLSKIANCSMQSVKSPFQSVVKRTKAQKIIAELALPRN